MQARTLDQLIIGESAVISQILNYELGVKLMEMGFLPGVVVKFHYKAPMGDPMCFSVVGYDVALRKEEAQCIQIVS